MESKKFHIGIIGGSLSCLSFVQLLKYKLNNQMDNILISIYERENAIDSRFQGWFLGINNESKNILSPLFHQNIKLADLFDFNDDNKVSSMFRMTDAFTCEPFFKVFETSYFIDRLKLRDALLENVDINWGHKFLSYQNNVDSITAIFTVNDVAVRNNFDILIGADGANSTVRKQFAPQVTYNDLGFTNIAGECPFDLLPPLIKTLTFETGALNRWLSTDGYTIMMLPGVKSNGAKIVLWVLSFPGSIHEWQKEYSDISDLVNDEYSESANNRNLLLEFCLKKSKNRFINEVIEVISNTPANSALFGPRQVYSIEASEIRSMLSQEHAKSSPRVVLLGDSAHATTTHRGLGANTAFRDAHDLVDSILEFLKNKISLFDSLDKYNKKMIPRAIQVINESKQTTFSIHSKGWKTFGRTYFYKCISKALQYFIPPATDSRSLKRKEINQLWENSFNKKSNSYFYIPVFVFGAFTAWYFLKSN